MQPLKSCSPFKTPQAGSRSQPGEVSLSPRDSAAILSFEEKGEIQPASGSQLAQHLRGLDPTNPVVASGLQELTQLEPARGRSSRLARLAAAGMSSSLMLSSLLLQAPALLGSLQATMLGPQYQVETVSQPSNLPSPANSAGAKTLHLEASYTGEPTLSVPARSVSYSPDGKHLLVTTSVGQIALFDAKTGQHLQTIQSATSDLSGVAFSPDGETLAVPLGNEVKLMDMASGKELQRLPGPNSEPVEMLAYSPDGKSLAAASASQLSVWDLSQSKRSRTWFGDGSSKFTGLAWSPDGSSLAYITHRDDLVLWDPQSSEVISELQPQSDIPDSGHTNWARKLAFSPDGQTLAATNDDEQIKVWNLKSKKVVGEFIVKRPSFGGRDLVDQLSFSPDSQTLAAVSYEQGITLFDLSSRKRILTLAQDSEPGTITSATFSPDGSTLAAGVGNKVALWNLQQTLQLQQEGKVIGQTSLPSEVKLGAQALSSASQTAAFSDSSGRIYHWNYGEGDQPESMEGKGGVPEKLVLNQQGNLLATYSQEEGEVTLYDLEARKPVAHLVDQSLAAPEQLRIDFAGDRLLVQASQGTGPLWSLQPVETPTLEPVLPGPWSLGSSVLAGVGLAAGWEQRHRRKLEKKRKGLEPSQNPLALIARIAQQAEPAESMLPPLRAFSPEESQQVRTTLLREIKDGRGANLRHLEQSTLEPYAGWAPAQSLVQTFCSLEEHFGQPLAEAAWPAFFVDPNSEEIERRLGCWELVRNVQPEQLLQSFGQLALSRLPLEQLQQLQEASPNQEDFLSKVRQQSQGIDLLNSTLSAEGQAQLQQVGLGELLGDRAGAASELAHHYRLMSQAGPKPSLQGLSAGLSQRALLPDTVRAYLAQPHQPHQVSELLRDPVQAYFAQEPGPASQPNGETEQATQLMQLILGPNPGFPVDFQGLTAQSCEKVAKWGEVILQELEHAQPLLSWQQSQELAAQLTQETEGTLECLAQLGEKISSSREILGRYVYLKNG